MLQPPRQTMQRKLNFTSSLHEISLRQSLHLNQPQPHSPSFPHAGLQSPFEGIANAPRQGLVSPSATPIGQMMEVRNWIQELQRTAQIDQNTGFIADMDRFLPQSMSADL